MPQIKILTVNGRRYRVDTKSLTTMEELETEGWRLSTPRIAKSLIERGLVRVYREIKGGNIVKSACKPGERADESGCTPLNRSIRKPKKPITDKTKKVVYNKITTIGISVRRGSRIKRGGTSYQSDPGDFGRGIYYTTSYTRASTYGDVEKNTLKLKNPIVLSVDEAYALSEKYETVRLSEEKETELFNKVGRSGIRQARVDELLKNSQRLTDDLLAKGHDGLVSISPRGEIEVVVFQPLSTKGRGIKKGKGEPCKQGETSAKDDCIPASEPASAATGEGSPSDKPGKPHRIAQEASGSKIRAVGRFVSRTFLEGLSAFLKGKGKALDTATRFKDAGYEKLSTKMQKRVDRVWGAVKYIEHKVMIGFSKGRQLAEESARERGLSRESVDKLGKVLSTIDVISAWTVNMPVTLVATGSMTAAKVASWVPVASLSYVAYSTSRNPLATLRAAKSLMKKGKGKEANKMVRNIAVKGNDYRRDDVTDALASGMQKAGEQLDWYLALVSSALDEMPDQPLEAIKTADEIFSKSPAPSGDDSEIGEEDIQSLEFDRDSEEVISRPINRLNNNGTSN